MLIIPLFSLYKLSSFSTLWIKKQITNNNKRTNTLSNKLFNTSHIQMEQHYANRYIRYTSKQTLIFTCRVTSINKNWYIYIYILQLNIKLSMLQLNIRLSILHLNIKLSMLQLNIRLSMLQLNIRLSKLQLYISIKAPIENIKLCSIKYYLI